MNTGLSRMTMSACPVFSELRWLLCGPPAALCLQSTPGREGLCVQDVYEAALRVYCGFHVNAPVI